MARAFFDAFICSWSRGAAKNIQSGKYGKQRLFYYLKSERCAPLYRSARTYQNCKCWEYELQRRSTRSNKSIQVLPEEEQILKQSLQKASL